MDNNRIELELTYLAKFVPKNLKEHKSVEIIDNYIPASDPHPRIRLRKYGDKLEITKKVPVKGKDSSKQYEYTIPLSEEEFRLLLTLPGRKKHQIRYYYPSGDKIAEFCIFKGDLEGLVIIDFEFDSEEEKHNFNPPDFCLADVTQEKYFAGGVLAGKSYPELEPELTKYGYQKISDNIST